MYTGCAARKFKQLYPPSQNNLPLVTHILCYSIRVSLKGPFHSFLPFKEKCGFPPYTLFLILAVSVIPVFYLFSVLVLVSSILFINPSSLRLVSYRKPNSYQGDAVGDVLPLEICIFVCRCKSTVYSIIVTTVATSVNRLSLFGFSLSVLLNIPFLPLLTTPV